MRTPTLPVPVSLAALALALAACAGVSWQKAGSDPESLKQDLGNCQALAYDKVSRPNPVVPPVSLDQRLGGQIDGPVRQVENRIREQQLVDRCMREKGYSFEPAAR